MNTIKILFFGISLLFLSAGSYAQYDNEKNENVKIEKNNFNKKVHAHKDGMKFTLKFF